MTDKNTDTKPTHTVRQKKHPGTRSDFETLGVAWERDDGVYVKLYGRQVVEGGFYVFRNKDSNADQGGQ